MKGPEYRLLSDLEGGFEENWVKMCGLRRSPGGITDLGPHAT